MPGGTTTEPKPALSREYLVTLKPTSFYLEAQAQAELELEQARAKATQLREQIMVLGDIDRQEGNSPLIREQLAQDSRDADRLALTLVAALDKIAPTLEHARKRDELALDRPDGCWCLGLGATGEVWVPGPNGAQDAEVVHTDYCECPDGRRIKLVEDGLRNAHQRRIDAVAPRRILRLASVPRKYRDASFDSYPVSDATRKHVEYLRRWADEFTPEGTSVFLRGDYGVGKTGLAVATMRAVMDKHQVDAYFIPVKALLSEIQATFGQKETKIVDGEEVPTTKQLQDAVKRVTLLVLDDIGAEGSSDWKRSTLFELLNERHNQEKRTIFTSNLALKALNELHGERLVWRIVEMCGGRDGRDGMRHIVGPNLRVPADDESEGEDDR